MKFFIKRCMKVKVTLIIFTGLPSGLRQNLTVLFYHPFYKNDQWKLHLVKDVFIASPLFEYNFSNIFLVKIKLLEY